MDSARPRFRVATAGRALARSPFALWVAFVLVHLWLGMLALYAVGLPLGDVTRVYLRWMQLGLTDGFWVGIDTVWVYPVVALVPMVAATVFGLAQYGATWLSMILLLNAVAFGFVTGWGRSRERLPIAWWWLGFLLLLGPIAVGRIDAVSVPLAIVGVILLATRPRAAAVAIALATWIKVWPVAIIAAALIALRQRWRVLGAVLIVSGAVVIIALVLGSGTNVFSFVTQQTGRGLQVESPVATIWMWQALAGVPGASVYYDQQILTYQIHGQGVEMAAAIMTPLLAVAVALIVLLGVRAVRAGASAAALFPPLTLALVTVLIALNKVGSPQFISWLAVPIVLGLATHAAGYGVSFRFPATIVFVIAALTQVIYPYLYLYLLSVNPLMLSVLTVRNLLEFVLLGWAVLAVVRASTVASDGTEPWLPSVWPFADRARAITVER